MSEPELGGVAAPQLRQFVERIERLEEEIKALNEDKASVYSEARDRGFDVKIIKKVIAIRRKDPDERTEEEALIEVYLRALGMLPEADASRVHAHEAA